jgi:translation initiation factor IF-2
MSDPTQIRINELARELEVKARAILEVLPQFGVTEKKTHSSSVEVDVAEKVRKHFLGLGEAEIPAAEAVPAAPEGAAAPQPSAAEHALPAPPAHVEHLPAPPSAAHPPARPAPASPAPAVYPRMVPQPVAPGAESAAPAAVAKPAVRTPLVVRPAAPGAAPARPAAPRPVAAASPAVRPATPGPKPQMPVLPQRPLLGGMPPPEKRTPMPRPPQKPPIPGTSGPGGRPAGGRPPRATAKGGDLEGGAAKAAPTGKPLYARKPPARGRPLAEKRFDEGERKLHPVRTRPGVGERRTARVEPAAQVRREPREITITEGISVRELAEKLDVRAKELLKTLLDKGLFASINQALDVQTATQLAEVFSGVVTVRSFEEEVVQEVAKEEKPAALEPRAPVVTVMGHVDHGKTSLLDAVREARVAEGEAGGITQHIGAYEVHVGGRKVVFIDTPGHEAFTRMRARGAKVTDIVVLVVAADDGVMPQTQEAIDHARGANVPIIVAINKIDKPEAQAERVKRQLADKGLLPEEWGGDTVMVEVSAKQKTNLDKLLEMVLLVADMRELKANPLASASGTVLESRVDKGRGPVATVLVQNGVLHVGDFFFCGAVYGKVRAMFDDRGQPLKEAGPSTPVEVLGLQGVPDAGDQFQVADESKARHIVDYRQGKLREASLARSAGGRITLDQLHEQLKTGEVKELPVVIKADVQGSVEVLNELLPKLSTDQVKIKILHASVGAVSETDVLLASASNAVIVSFNVRPDRKAVDLAQQENVDIRTHTIIYELIDEMKKALTGMLEPVFKETYLGRAQVRDTFRIKGVGTVAGCIVQDGVIKRDAELRVLRDNVVVYTGRVSSLKRFKDDASEVRSGFECGMGIQNFNDIKAGDIFEFFTVQKLAVAEATA